MYIFIILLVICILLCRLKPSNYTFLLPSLTCNNNLISNQYTLYKEGVACGLGKIDNILCDYVKKEIIEWKKQSNETMYGDINTIKNRYDLFLPLEGYSLHLVRQLLFYWKNNNLTLYNPNASIIEVGALITLPKAEGQSIHIDTSDTIKYKDCISFGVFLHDVDKQLAPLVVKPDNNNIIRWKCVTGKKGDVYGWSSIIDHGGGANTTKQIRYLFYITIMYPPIKEVDVGGYSLLSKYGKGIKVKSIL